MLDQQPSGKLTRRDFLKLGTIVAVGALIPNSNGQPTPLKSLIDSKNRLKPEATLTRIHQIVEDTGASPLDIEQAKELASLSVDFYTQTTSTSHTAEELRKRLIIVSDDYETGSQIDEALEQIQNGGSEANPIIEHLRQDYPDLHMDDQFAGRILKDLSEPMRDGWTDRLSATVFIPFRRVMMTNGSKSYIGKVRRNLPYQIGEYREFTDKHECSLIRPSINFMASVMHELGHLDGLLSERPIEYQFAQALKRQNIPIGDTQTVSGFVLDCWNGENLVKRNNDLDELVTDYIQAVVMKRANLPFALKNLEPFPYHYYNFSKILEVAGINDDELIRMYRGGNLFEFLVRIGLPASNISKYNGDHLAFAVDKFLNWKPSNQTWLDINYNYFGYPAPQSPLVLHRQADDIMEESAKCS